MYICIYFIFKYWMYILNKYYKWNILYYGCRGFYMNIFIVIIKNVFIIFNVIYCFYFYWNILFLYIYEEF